MKVVTISRKVEVNSVLSGTKQNALARSTTSTEGIRKYLNSYLDHVFPSVYSTDPWYLRLLEEVRKNHRYILIFSAKSDAKARFVTTVHLLTVQTMLMFILCMFYDVQV